MLKLQAPLLLAGMPAPEIPTVKLVPVTAVTV
jgi:hypothetical protein